MLRVEKESLNRKIGMLEVKVDNFQIEISRNHHIGDLNRQLGKLKAGFFPRWQPRTADWVRLFPERQRSVCGGNALKVCGTLWFTSNLLKAFCASGFWLCQHFTKIVIQPVENFSRCFGLEIRAKNEISSRFDSNGDESTVGLIFSLSSCNVRCLCTCSSNLSREKYQVPNPRDHCHTTC